MKEDILSTTDWVDDLFNEILNASSIDELDAIKVKLRLPKTREDFVMQIGHVYQLNTDTSTKNWMAYVKVTDKVIEWIEKRTLFN